MTESSFVKALFQGVIAEQILCPYPVLASEERETIKMMVDNVRRYFEANVNSSQIDKEQNIPESVLAGMKQLGLFGMTVPTEFGGIGLSATAFGRVLEEIAGQDISSAMVLGTHQALGFSGLQFFGTESQKARYLPRLARGESIAAFALREPFAGSEASALSTSATLAPDGESYLINGAKSWVTNGAIADLFTVFAKTQPVGEGGPSRITAFLVEKNMGLRPGPPQQKLGIRGTTTTNLVLDEVRVPAANVLYEVGRGVRVVADVLSFGRLAMACICVGACKRMIRMATDRALDRQALGKRIGDFPLVKEKIAQMMSETWALESMTYLTAGLADSRVADYSLESALCKLMASETVWRAAHELVQVAGGAGYMTGTPYERYLRDSRVHLILPGTNEILRVFVALSAIPQGKGLSEGGRAFREPLWGLGLIGELAVRKAKSALGRPKLSRMHPSLGPQVLFFEEATAQLAKAVDKALRRHGKQLAELQLVQQRLTDLALELYGLGACLSRTQQLLDKKGEQGAARELRLTQVFAQGASRRIEALLAALERNEDEARMAVAEQTYQDRGYPMDLL